MHPAASICTHLTWPGLPTVCTTVELRSPRRDPSSSSVAAACGTTARCWLMTGLLHTVMARAANSSVVNLGAKPKQRSLSLVTSKQASK